MLLVKKPQDGQIKTQQLEKDGNQDELNSDATWYATRDQFVAGMSITALHRSANEIIVDIVNGKCPNEDAIEQGHILDQRIIHKPIQKQEADGNEGEAQTQPNHDTVG